jgi:hypothetical protein
MKTDEMLEPPAARTSEADSSAVTARAKAHHQFRLLAIMVHGTPGALPDAWRSYRNADEARVAARETMRNQHVLRLAILEDRPPLQFIEWVDR